MTRTEALESAIDKVRELHEAGVAPDMVSADGFIRVVWYSPQFGTEVFYFSTEGEP